MSFCLLFVTGEQTISHTQVRVLGGGQKNCLSTGDKHFSHTAGGGDKHFFTNWAGQTFF